MRRILLVLCLTLLPVSAMAQTATLSWQAPAVDATHGAATGYKLYKGTNATCSQQGVLASLLATLGNVFTASDSVLTSGDTVCYELTATNAGGESPHSNRITKVVPTNPPQAPTLNVVIQ